MKKFVTNFFRNFVKRPKTMFNPVSITPKPKKHAIAKVLSLLVHNSCATYYSKWRKDWEQPCRPGLWAAEICYSEFFVAEIAEICGYGIEHDIKTFHEVSKNT